MRPEEGTYLANRERNPLLRLLPRKHADFGVRRQHRGLHGDRVRMRRDIVRQNEHRRLAVAHEIARHREDEVGIGAIHLGQELVDRLHRDVGPAFGQLRAPTLHVVFVEKVALLGTRPAGLRQHGCDNTIGCPLQEVPETWRTVGSLSEAATSDLSRLTISAGPGIRFIIVSAKEGAVTYSLSRADVARFQRALVRVRDFLSN